jgi:aquaporin TIP
MKPSLLPALVAELVGTFALCFVGIMAIHWSGNPVGSGLVGVALAHGLILGLFITITAATSGGHLNPAVTIGLLFGGKIKAPDAFAYIVAQCLGGMLAGFVVVAILGSSAAPAMVGGVEVIPETAAQIVAQGTPQLNHVTLFGGLLAEAVATFFLVSAVWGTAVDPRAPKIGGFGIGISLIASILAIGPITGAALNPARAFGPALAASLCGAQYPWGTMWLYWVGPILGGIVASLIYKGFFYPKES